MRPHASRLTLLLLIVVALTSAPSARAADAPANISFTPDVVYATVGGEELKLNLSVPKNASGKLPCVLVIHGGAWRAGDRAAHNDLTWHFAQQGYVSATVGYRFCPEHVFPAQVQDVKAAVRFLRANADKYHIDPDRIGAVGFSAGAHLSMMLGVMDAADGLDDAGGSDGHSSKVQAVVAFFGPTDFELPLPEPALPLVRDFLGGTIDEKRDAYRRASPATYADKGDAPMLLFQGTSDPLVPTGQATRMADAMHKAGVPGRVELLVGAAHGWGGAELTRTAAATFAFFAEHLKGSASEGQTTRPATRPSTSPSR
jgi:acetyl esterase/lipase